MITQVSNEQIERLRVFLFRVRDGLPTGLPPDLGVPYEVTRTETGAAVAGLLGELVESRHGLSDSFSVCFADCTFENAISFRRLAKA